MPDHPAAISNPGQTSKKQEMLERIGRDALDLPAEFLYPVKKHPGNLLGKSGGHGLV